MIFVVVWAIGSRKLKNRGFGIVLGNRMGKKALAFTLSDDNGGEIWLDDFKGSWLLMVFHRHLA